MLVKFMNYCALATCYRDNSSVMKRKVWFEKCGLHARTFNVWVFNLWRMLSMSYY